MKYQRGSTWYARLTDAGGTTHRISLKTSDERIATEKHAELELALLRGNAAVRPQGYTLRDAFERAMRMHYKGRKSASTAAIHRMHVYAAVPPETPLASLRVTHVDSIIDKQRTRGVQDRTINRTLSTLSQVLKLAQEAGMMGVLPFKMPRFEEYEGRIRVYTEAELAAFVAEFERVGHPVMGHLCTLMFDTGLRLGEALKLDCITLHHDTRKVTLWETKGGTHRTVPLTKRAYMALIAFMAHDPLTKDQVHAFWSVARRNLGLAGDKEAVLHSFRHTCATRLALGGMDVRSIMLWMGHKDIKTTMRYINVAANNLSAAVLEVSSDCVESVLENEVESDSLTTGALEGAPASV